MKHVLIQDKKKLKILVTFNKNEKKTLIQNKIK